MVNARRKLAICSTLNCNPSFAIGGNSIEFVDEWLHLGHMINKHFTDDMDITLCKNRLKGNANRVLCHFGKLDSVIKNRLFKAYCSGFFTVVKFGI